MSSDTASSTARGDDAVQLSAKWRSERRHSRDDIDRTSLVESICAALGSGPNTMLDVAAAAAALGAAYVTSGQTLNGLVEELDLLEGIWIDHIFVHDSRTSPRRLRILHVLLSTARRSAIAAFAHASASATKKRIRVGRHDIANAIGAVRNAVVLMDEATDVTREHLRGIARRNSFSAETLVRLHLSDSAVLTTALGWQDLTLSQLSERLAPPERSEPAPSTAKESRRTTNVGALDAIVSTLRSVYDGVDGPETERVTVAVVATSARSGLLTVDAPTLADRGDDPTAMDSMRQLSDALGLRLEEGSSLAHLRVTFPLSGGDERHDLGGAGQGHHTDAVRL